MYHCIARDSEDRQLPTRQSAPISEMVGGKFDGVGGGGGTLPPVTIAAIDRSG